MQQVFANAASLFLANVRLHVYLVLIRHLSAISGCLGRNRKSKPLVRICHGATLGVDHRRTAHDIFFARRTIHQLAATPDVAPALAKEAEELLALLPPLPSQPGSPIPGANTGGAAAPPGSPNPSLCEPCPACNTAIPLGPPDAESAVCANGHVWGACPVPPPSRSRSRRVRAGVCAQNQMRRNSSRPARRISFVS